MNAPKLFALLAFLGLSPVAAAAAASSESEAGDISEVDKDSAGPLRNRVPPVSGSLFLKKGRFELSPGITASITDAFYTKYILGASLTYFPGETLGVGLRFGYGLPVVSGAAQICTNGADGLTRGCNQPSLGDLESNKAPGEIQLVGGLDLQWAPIYGKISLSGEKFLHFDMYGLAGGTLVQYGKGPGSSEMTFGGNLGLGMRFVGTRWLAVRLELRDLIYSETGTGTSAAGDSKLRQQLVVDLGLSFFFPTTFNEG
ncbi:MAG: outer membrane beta-barrel domain-containing protein [Myxococcaceae bacterium]